MYRFILLITVEVLTLITFVTSHNIPMRFAAHHGDSIARVKRQVALNKTKSTEVSSKSIGSLCLIADNTCLLTVATPIIAILVAQLVTIVIMICLIRVLHRRIPILRPLNDTISHIYERIDENAPRTIVRRVTLQRGYCDGYMDMTFAKVAQNDHGQTSVEVHDYDHDRNNDDNKASEAEYEPHAAINPAAGSECSVTGVWAISTGGHNVECDSQMRRDSEYEQNDDASVRIYL